MKRELMTHARGHGKVARMEAQIEALRRWNSRPEAFIPDKAPDVGEVRWACRQPTAPVYPEWSAGWMMAQWESRLTHQMVEHNRKLNAQWNAKVYAVQELLGVQQHGSNDSQVPEGPHQR